MPRASILWLAAAAGPVIWLLSFGANFSLAGWVCEWHGKSALYVISSVALAMVVGSALLAWTQWQKLGRELPGEGVGAAPRSRILAIGGVLLGALSFLLILAQAIVQTILGECQ